MSTKETVRAIDTVASLHSSLDTVMISSSSNCSSTSTNSQPLKPAKKYRADDDGDKQIVRCKRKLDFVPDTTTESTTSGDVTASTSSCVEKRRTSRHRPPAAVARRNERERKRVSLINRTFETLRDQLPRSMWGHRQIGKVSKVETLRAAIGYIRTLQDLLATAGEDSDDLEKYLGNDVDDLTDGSSSDNDVERLSKPDIAIDSAERLGALAMVAPPAFEVSAFDVQPSADGVQQCTGMAYNTRGLFPSSEFMPVANNNVAEYRLLPHQHQRMMIDATHRLALLTSGSTSFSSTSSQPRSLIEKMSQVTDDRQVVVYDNSGPLDINSNHRVDWRHMADDKAEALTSSCVRYEMPVKVDTLAERRRLPRNMFCSDTSTGSLSDMERYLYGSVDLQRRQQEKI